MNVEIFIGRGKVSDHVEISFIAIRQGKGEIHSIFVCFKI